MVSPAPGPAESTKSRRTRAHRPQSGVRVRLMLVGCFEESSVHFAEGRVRLPRRMGNANVGVVRPNLKAPFFLFRRANTRGARRNRKKEGFVFWSLPRVALRLATLHDEIPSGYACGSLRVRELTDINTDARS